MIELSENQFKSALENGLGRAYLFIRNYGKNHFNEVLLEACLNNWVYDNQCESDRADWLFSIIEMTEKQKEYEEKILNNLPFIEDYWNAEQILNLLKEFARRGSLRSRQSIYKFFDESPFQESDIGGIQIIDLDGIQGFIHIAEKIGFRLKVDKEYWEDEYLLNIVKERYGKDKVEKLLSEKILTSQNLTEYLNHINQLQNEEESTTKGHKSNWKKKLSLNDILNYVENCYGSVPALYSRFGEVASADDLEVVFEKLCSEEREGQLLRLLWVFRYRELPNISNKLIELLDHSNEEIYLACIAALSNNKDSRVKAVANRLLSSQKWKDTVNGIILLKQNCDFGDGGKLNNILKKLPNSIDRHYTHEIVRNILLILDSNSLQENELFPCALWCYENSPCTLCRKDIVKKLLDIDKLPESLLSECKFDASKEIRELVDSNLKI